MSEQCKHLDTRLRPAYLGQIHPEDTTATLDSIVAALSHEINNSLTPIIGLTSPAMQSCAYSPEVRMILNSIFSAGCRIAETMESLAFLQHPTPTQENDTRFSLDNLLAELIKNENSFRRESISFSNTGVFLQGHYNVFKALISSLIKLAGKEPSSDAAPIYIYTIHPSASRHFLLITGSDKYQDRKKGCPGRLNQWDRVRFLQ